MSRVRALRPDDIPHVAELHALVFADSSDLGPEERQRYLRQVFLENPWRDESLSSLVSEDERGGIVGFLGVVPRPMSRDGRSISVAVGSQFMVAPSHRGLTGMQLMKTFLSGPQDLSLTDGPTRMSTKIWKAFGGTESPLHSIHWTRPLRPALYACSLADDRKSLAPLTAVARPLCSALDSLITSLRRGPFALPAVPAGDELTAGGLLDCFRELPPRAALRPVHDLESMKWLLEMAGRKSFLGHLRMVRVRNAANEVIGWYACYVKRGRRCEVLQMAGRSDALDQVLDHLFYHAWRAGAIAVSGRLQAEFFDALKIKHCFFHGVGAPLLVHSRHSDLVDTVRGGNACLTRLDGEWWMPFHRPARSEPSS